MLFLEKWIENALKSSRSFDPNQRLSGMEYLGVDRVSLTNYGLSKQDQDRVYRAIFVYSKGIHDITRSFKSVGNLTQKLWTAFLFAFENLEPKSAEILAQEVKREHLDRIQEGILQHKEKAEEMKEEIDTLSSGLVETKLFAEDLEAKLSFEQASNELLRERLADAHSSLDQLMKNFEQEKTQRCEAEELLRARVGELSKMRSENNYLRYQFKSYKDSSQKLEVDFSHQSLVNEGLKQSLETQIMKLQSLATDARVAEIRIQEFTEEIARLNGSLQMASDGCDKYRLEATSMRILLGSTSASQASCFNLLKKSIQLLLRYDESLRKCRIHNQILIFCNCFNVLIEFFCY